MPASPLLDSVGTPDPSGDRTLVRLTDHVRALLPAGAVLIVTGERFAAWFDGPYPRSAGAHALELELNEPVMLPRLDEWAASPGLMAVALRERARDAWRAYRSSSVIACPLGAQGVLVVVAADPARRFSADDLRVARVVADLAELPLEQAIDFERDRRIARALTLGFVPESLPVLGDYETGLLYRPALGELTGGDLYGMWQLPSGSVAALIGDVSGKGVETAAMSAMVRFFVEARSWGAESPAQALEQTNAMLRGRLPSDTFVTAFFAVLSPRCLRWASAGHLPPLHVSGGSVGELESTGVPLGVDQGSTYEEHALELADGDLIFAYTDGLVEARRDEETYGSTRFAALVAHLADTLGPQQLTQAVHDEVASWAGGLSDDAVALALRRRPAAKRGRFTRRPAARSA
jgi:serine phosphatase RsbU (regulator of sigma subunit)